MSIEQMNQGVNQAPDNEATSALNKIRDAVKHVENLIRDLEARKTESLPPSQAGALLSVLGRERAKLTPLLLELQKQEALNDERYMIIKGADTRPGSEDLFDAALAQTGEARIAKRIEDAREAAANEGQFSGERRVAN